MPYISNGTIKLFLVPLTEEYPVVKSNLSFRVLTNLDINALVLYPVQLIILSFPLTDIKLQQVVLSVPLLFLVLVINKNL